ncbi:MAG TPA: response regulator [Minicystis sp.]|nr:response regulator [Minicystis sp.]
MTRDASADPTLEPHAARLAADLVMSGPRPRMQVLEGLEARGLGFGDAIRVVAFALSRGLVERAGEHGADLAAPAPASKPGRILLVEDEHALRQEVAALLREEGYDVVEAEDGLQAIDLLRDPPAPALVLLDLLMPGATGWDVLAWMRTVPPLAGVPVRVLSAIGAAIRVEGARVLGKPLDLGELLAAVAEHCA